MTYWEPIIGDPAMAAPCHCTPDAPCTARTARAAEYDRLADTAPHEQAADAFRACAHFLRTHSGTKT